MKNLGTPVFHLEDEHCNLLVFCQLNFDYLLKRGEFDAIIEDKYGKNSVKCTVLVTKDEHDIKTDKDGIIYNLPAGMVTIYPQDKKLVTWEDYTLVMPVEVYCTDIFYALAESEFDDLPIALYHSVDKVLIGWVKDGKIEEQ